MDMYHQLLDRLEDAIADFPHFNPLSDHGFSRLISNYLKDDSLRDARVIFPADPSPTIAESYSVVEPENLSGYSQLECGVILPTEIAEKLPQKSQLYKPNSTKYFNCHVK